MTDVERRFEAFIDHLHFFGGRVAPHASYVFTLDELSFKSTFFFICLLRYYELTLGGRMESSRTTLNTEESSRLTVKPSSTVLRPVTAFLAERKGPRYGREIVDGVEEAMKSNDFWTTSQWLQVFKEEFSRNDQWPPDVLDRIWKCVINVLRGCTEREVKTPNCELHCTMKLTSQTRRLSCQILEALAQNNESCERNDTSEVSSDT